MRRFVLLAWVTMGAAVLACGPAWAQKKLPLVIGNDAYANLPVLQTAVNDAQAVSDALAGIGFEVIRGHDLGRPGMIDKLAAFTAKLEPGDTALFFYAGHGVAIGNVNYLVPSDAPAATAGAEARVRGASIAEADVIAEIQGKGARVAVLIIDACRDNPFPRAGTRTLGHTRGLVTTPSSLRGVFSLYSAGIGQTALDRLQQDDPSRNSVFTRVLVEHLTRPGIHLAELAFLVRERVAQIALQAKDSSGEPAPHEQTPAYYDQTIGGRVYLAGRGAESERHAPTAPPAADEIAWSLIQDTSDLGPLRRFVEQFPTSPRRPDADARMAALERAARTRADDNARRSREAARPPEQPAGVPPPAAALPSGTPSAGKEWCEVGLKLYRCKELASEAMASSGAAAVSDGREWCEVGLKLVRCKDLDR
jgi:hypothetical protein